MGAQRCEACGAELAAASKFCTECGRSAAPEPPAAVTPLDGHDGAGANSGAVQGPAEDARPEPFATGPGEGKANPDDQGPPPGYVPPHLQERRPTVREVHLDGVLLLIAGALAVGAGFENLGVPQAQHVVLGIVAIVVGGLFLATVIAPAALGPLERYKEFPWLGASALLIVWGLVAALASNVGVLGGLLVASGGLALAAMGLRMGMLR